MSKSFDEVQDKFFDDLWDTLPKSQGGKELKLKCPCCDRPARIYRRPFNAGMARSLMRIYKRNKLRLYNSKLTSEREESKLVWWGLLKRKEHAVYRVTPKGKKFVMGEITIPGVVFEFGSKPLEFEGPEVYIHQALDEPFEYDTLMSG